MKAQEDGYINDYDVLMHEAVKPPCRTDDTTASRHEVREGVKPCALCQCGNHCTPRRLDTGGIFLVPFSTCPGVHQTLRYLDVTSRGA